MSLRICPECQGPVPMFQTTCPDCGFRQGPDPMRRYGIPIVALACIGAAFMVAAKIWSVLGS